MCVSRLRGKGRDQTCPLSLFTVKIELFQRESGLHRVKRAKTDPSHETRAP